MSRCGRLLGGLLHNKIQPKSALRKNNYVGGVTAVENKFQFSRTRGLYTSPALAGNVAFKLSDIGEGIREVAVKEWFVKVGDKVKQFDNICEVQSDKASVTITSRYDGVVTKLHYKVDDTALVGQPLLDIDAEGEEGDVPEVAKTPEEPVKPKIIEEAIKSPQVPSGPASYKRDICIPSVRRLAKEHNIDLTQVEGTGKDGRILKEDVLAYMKDPSTSRVPIIQAPTLALHDKTEAIKGFRKAMVKTMTEANKIPTFVYSDEMAVTKLSKLRLEVKEEFLAQGIKISYMPFFIKAISNALVKYPILNATVDANCENVTYKASHNIGIAMDTKVGLAVPVISNCQSLTIVEIAKELNRLMTAGKTGSFDPKDLAGGTFTLSNIGAIGGTYTKPVILPPQVALLALGAAKLLPRFDKDMNVIPEEIVSLSGAADHRVVDGATMANFSNAFKRQIENPSLLFLNL